MTVHELGHQWFYGLVATDEHGWPFLDEGVNSYAEVDAMEARDPGHARRSAPSASRVGIAAVNRVGAADAEHDAPRSPSRPPTSLSGRDYGALVYERTATILDTLAQRLRQGRGAPRRRALRAPLPLPAPGPGRSSSRPCARSSATTPPSSSAPALFDRATVDYAVGDRLLQGRRGDGYSGSVLVRRRGALRFPVDVDLVEESGAVQRVRWDAAEGAARLPFHGKSKLVGAVIDPEHRVLLDDDLANNARGPRSRLSGGLLDRLSFAAEALLGGLLP